MLHFNWKCVCRGERASDVNETPRSAMTPNKIITNVHINFPTKNWAKRGKTSCPTWAFCPSLLCRRFAPFWVQGMPICTIMCNIRIGNVSVLDFSVQGPRTDLLSVYVIMPWCTLEVACWHGAPQPVASMGLGWGGTPTYIFLKGKLAHTFMGLYL